MTDDGLPNDENAGDIAPRPRPGFRSRPAVDTFQKAGLFAGIVRATLGAAGLFASLLYMPINIATPILAGVSILMMVTGSTSAWRSVRSAPPGVRKIPLFLAGGCALATVVSIAMTALLGAGSLGPVAEARARAAEEAREAARDAPPTVRFEPAP